jgi:integrase
LGQHRRVDPARDLPKIVDRSLQLHLRGGELLAQIRVADAQLADQREPQQGRQEPLLRTVVQVALELATLRIAGPGEPRPGVTQLAQGLLPSSLEFRVLRRRERNLEHVQDAKPSTLRDHRFILAEPGQAHRRGKGTSRGLVMSALGARPAPEISTRDVEELLRSISSTGVAPRTVNKVRQLVCAIFHYGMRPSTYGLVSNPATHADRRREPERGPLAFYAPEQVEVSARSLAAGAHRDSSRPALSDNEIMTRAHEDAQDGELVRIAAYAGLRRGELVALRWRDVDFAGRKIIVRRALSGETELRSTKSRRAREVPLPDQAAAALDRLSRRDEFTGPDDYVFANRLGRRLDPSALRRRFERARDAAGLEPLRFHDLRHTYGSLLVAGGIDLASVKAAMGHSRITTTERYLHARPAWELADRFTLALAGTAATPELSRAA